MKHHRILKFLLVTLSLAGVSLPAARAGKLFTTPATPPPATQAALKLHTLASPDGNLTSTSTLLEDGAASYNIARQFNIGVQHYLLLLNGNNGSGVVRHLQADGQLGGTEQIIVKNDGLRCTSAEIIKIGGVTYLATHHAFSGKLRHFAINQSGQVQTGAPFELTHTALRDKHLFSPFDYNGQYYYFGLDTWTGKAVLRLPNGQIVEDEFSRGWTSLDHLTVGATTFRLLYKAAGDPHLDNNEEFNSNDKAGRFVIQQLTGNGMTGNPTYESLTSADWSQVRFMRNFDGNGALKYSLFFYNRENGDYRVTDFNSQTGTPGIVVTAQGNLGAGATEVETYGPAAPQLYVYTLNGDGAQPLTFTQIEKMAHTIHDEMANKAVGYQFALMQSGRVVYSRAWGKSRLDVSTDMTNQTRLDLGSVGKMITAVTVLKLAELGDIQLFQPLAGQLDPVKYPAGNLHSWVAQRTPLNLLTHTSGKKGGACKAIYLDSNGQETFSETDTPTYKTDCTDFLSGAPDAELACGSGYGRAYNNANFGTLRELIEHARNVETAYGVDSQTGQLWANAVGLGGISCQYESNVRYFARCNEQEDCYQYNNNSWSQGQPPIPWARSCGAGGWSASSREMLEFMAALRYQRILSSSYNNLLLSTELINCGDGLGSNALSWEPPWEAGGEKLLGKNGSGTDDDYGYRSYISRLPNNADVVLLVNTVVPDPTGLVQAAYKYATDPEATAPKYLHIPRIGEENEEASTGSIDRLAIGQIAYSEPEVGDVDKHFVTAVRMSYLNTMKLSGWRVQADGPVSRESDLTVGGAIKDLAITDGQAFVTAVRRNDDQLQLRSWTTGLNQINTISLHGSATAGPISKVAVTKLAGSGALHGRVVTAVRNGSGNLQLDVWDFNNLADTITLKDTASYGPITEVAVRAVRYGSSLSQTTRFVTAVRNGSQKLQVDLWEVSGAGQITRLGGDVPNYQVSNDASSQKKIAIGGWGTENFFVAFIKDDGNMQLVGWRTNAAGTVYSPKTAEAGAKTEVAITGLVTVVRTSDGKLQLIQWHIATDGSIISQGSTDADTVKLVAAAGRVLTPISLDDNKLKLINWEVVY